MPFFVCKNKKTERNSVTVSFYFLSILLSTHTCLAYFIDFHDKPMRL